MFSFRRLTSTLAYVSASMFVVGIGILVFREPRIGTSYNFSNVLYGLYMVDPLAFFLLGIIMLLASSIIYMFALAVHLVRSRERIYAFILMVFVVVILILFTNLVFL
ncbi:MAG: hypothetical protein ACP6IP_09510 [Candidatus Njordarchaeia archaeon]